MRTFIILTVVTAIVGVNSHNHGWGNKLELKTHVAPVVVPPVTTTSTHLIGDEITKTMIYEPVPQVPYNPYFSRESILSGLNNIKPLIHEEIVHSAPIVTSHVAPVVTVGVEDNGQWLDDTWLPQGGRWIDDTRIWDDMSTVLGVDVMEPIVHHRFLPNLEVVEPVTPVLPVPPVSPAIPLPSPVVVPEPVKIKFESKPIEMMKHMKPIPEVVNPAVVVEEHSVPVPVKKVGLGVGELVSGKFDFVDVLGKGAFIKEEGHLKKIIDTEVPVMTGTYSWVDMNGKKYVTKWIADENGFRAVGEHLPKMSMPVVKPVVDVVEPVVKVVDTMVHEGHGWSR